MRENVLTTDDLIWPLFVVGGHNTRACGLMPGVDRLTVDQTVRDAERAAKLNIPYRAVSLPSRRSASTARRRLIRQSGLPGGARDQKEFPDLGVLCDVALDPFTSHAMTD